MYTQLCFCGKEAKRNIKEQKPQDKHPESPKHCTIQDTLEAKLCQYIYTSVTHSGYRNTSKFVLCEEFYHTAAGMKLFPLPHSTEL